jgi:hypothetical protein
MKLTAVLLLVVAAFFGGKAHATYDFYRVQCVTLTGTGYVMLWLADKEYKINIDCEAKTK